MSGPPPSRSSRCPLPYGRQQVGEDDIAAVVQVLRSDLLTTGPLVEEFEAVVARFVQSREAVAVANGTAALHAAMHAVGIRPGDEVIVPAMTFAATAGAVVFQGGSPRFADVDATTLLVDPESVAARITARTRAVIAVDYAGQPCDYDALRTVCDSSGKPGAIAVVADGCHALGATDRGRPVGSLAELTAFSFHPVKPITTAEGGMITTNDPGLARRMRSFRNHGITADHRRRAEQGSWSYEIAELGYNYRLSDVQCALGISQLPKLPGWVARRREIASRYDGAFAGLPGVYPLAVRPGVEHGYHLYVVRLRGASKAGRRARIFRLLRKAGIGVNVHYLPVHLHPYYRRSFGTHAGLCPVAEAAYEEILTLPIFPAMSDRDVDDVVHALRTAVSESER